MKCSRALTLAAFGLAGCASAPAIVVPEVPATLQPAVTQIVSAELLAEGVQIYECAINAGRSEWAFKGPEATLSLRDGRAMGKHYGGPTWEAPDGSKVVAEVAARVDSRDPNAIPHLLLRAKHVTGDGAFSKVKSIQRLDTVGGKAPAPATCTKAGDVARIPYKATYYFYVEKA